MRSTARQRDNRLRDSGTSSADRIRSLDSASMVPSRRNGQNQDSDGTPVVQHPDDGVMLRRRFTAGRGCTRSQGAEARWISVKQEQPGGARHVLLRGRHRHPVLTRSRNTFSVGDRYLDLVLGTTWPNVLYDGRTSYESTTNSFAVNDTGRIPRRVFFWGFALFFLFCLCVFVLEGGFFSRALCACNLHAARGRGHK